MEKKDEKELVNEQRVTKTPIIDILSCRPFKGANCWKIKELLDLAKEHDIFIPKGTIKKEEIYNFLENYQLP